MPLQNLFTHKLAEDVKMKTIQILIPVFLLFWINTDNVFSQNYYPVKNNSQWSYLSTIIITEESSAVETSFVFYDKIQGTEIIDSTLWFIRTITDGNGDILSKTNIRSESNVVYQYLNSLNNNDEALSFDFSLGMDYDTINFNLFPGDTSSTLQVMDTLRDQYMGTVTIFLEAYSVVQPLSQADAYGVQYFNCFHTKTYLNIDMYDSSSFLMVTLLDTVESFYAENLGLVLSTENGHASIMGNVPETLQFYSKTELLAYSPDISSKNEFVQHGKHILPNISFYPNPARDHLTIILAPDQVKTLRTISIFDVRGKLVYQLNPYLSQFIEWDLRTLNNRKLPSGKYFYHLRSFAILVSNFFMSSLSILSDLICAKSSLTANSANFFRSCEILLLS